MLGPIVFATATLLIYCPFAAAGFALIIAMILGDTDELSDDIKEDFLNSNLYHILSVSGLSLIHIYRPSHHESWKYPKPVS